MGMIILYKAMFKNDTREQKDAGGKLSVRSSLKSDGSFCMKYANRLTIQNQIIRFSLGTDALRVNGFAGEWGCG